MKPIIKVRNLKKEYDGKVIVDVKHMDLYQDRIYFVLGENGAGKSTLLKMITNVISPSSGALEFCLNSDVGYLPQEPYIFDMSVHKNMKLAVKDKSKILNLLKSFELEQLQYSKANYLSGGEKQRLGFLRVICNHHNILVLDEPTSSLDIRASRLIEQAIQKYKEETNSCIIITTHDIAFSKRMADDIILMSHGKIVRQGDFSHVFLQEDENASEFMKYYHISEE